MFTQCRRRCYHYYGIYAICVHQNGPFTVRLPLNSEHSRTRNIRSSLESEAPNRHEQYYIYIQFLYMNIIIEHLFPLLSSPFSSLVFTNTIRSRSACSKRLMPITWQSSHEGTHASAWASDKCNHNISMCCPRMHRIASAHISSGYWWIERMIVNIGKIFGILRPNYEMKNGKLLHSLESNTVYSVSLYLYTMWGVRQDNEIS